MTSGMSCTKSYSLSDLRSNARPKNVPGSGRKKQKKYPPDPLRAICRTTENFPPPNYITTSTIHIPRRNQTLSTPAKFRPVVSNEISFPVSYSTIPTEGQSRSRRYQNRCNDGWRESAIQCHKPVKTQKTEQRRSGIAPYMSVGILPTKPALYSPVLLRNSRPG